MLSLELAYQVPFRVDRTDAPRLYHVTNMSLETLECLSMTHLGTGYCPPLRVRHLAPGDTLSVAVFGADRESTGIVIVRWRRPDRSEYLWRMSLGPQGLVA
jgi:hypothetical protein